MFTTLRGKVGGEGQVGFKTAPIPGIRLLSRVTCTAALIWDMASRSGCLFTEDRFARPLEGGKQPGNRDSSFIMKAFFVCVRSASFLEEVGEACAS